MREETLLVHAGRHISDDYDFVNPPVIRASTVLHRSAEDMVNNSRLKPKAFIYRNCKAIRH